MERVQLATALTQSLFDLFSQCRSSDTLITQIQEFSEARKTLLRQWFRDSPVPVFLTGSYARGSATLFSDLDLIFQRSVDDMLEGKLERWIEDRVYPLYEIFPSVSHAFRDPLKTQEEMGKDFRIFFSLNEARRLDTGVPFFPEGMPAGTKIPQDDLFRHMRKRWDRFSHSPLLVEMHLKEGPGAQLDHENYARLFPKDCPPTLKEDWEAVLTLRLKTQARILGTLGELSAETLVPSRLLRLQRTRSVDALSKEMIRELPLQMSERLFRATARMYILWQKVLQPAPARAPVETLPEWFRLSRLSKTEFNDAYLSGSFEKLFPVMMEQLYRCSDSATHRFTVGWHSSECIKVVKDVIAEVVTPPPLGLQRALKHIQNPELLYLVVFLHDVGKGQNEDHSVWGGRWIREYFQKSLDEEQRELSAWLVEQHLELHRRAMKEDVFSPDTLKEMAAWAGNPKRWAHLYLLTIADLIGTNKNLWTSWRAQIVGNFFMKVMDVLEGSVEKPEAVAIVLQGLPQEYRLSRTAQSQRTDKRVMQKAQESGFGLEVETDPTVGFDVLIVSIREDVFGILATLVETLYKERIGVWRTRTYQLHDGILDLIWIYPYDAVEAHLSPARRRQLKQKLGRPLDALMAKRPPPAVPSLEGLKKSLSAVVEDTASLTYRQQGDLIDVSLNCRDREGLLRDIFQSFVSHGFSVASANIGTTGERAIDHFLIQGADKS